MKYEPARFWDHLDEPDPDRRNELGRRLLDLGKEYESGTISTGEFEGRFQAVFGHTYPLSQLILAFEAVLPHAVDGMEEIVGRASAHCETALVSNTNPIHFRLCLDRIPALRKLDRFYLSYEIGAMKPSGRFYEAVLEGEGIGPEELLFIDDLEENVRGARAAGMKGVVFEGSEGLEVSLRELGI